MLTSFFICDVISFFGAKRKPSYLLNDLKNFNEFFRKDVAENNVKCHKKQGFILFLENTFLEKPKEGERGSDWPPPSFLRVKECNKNRAGCKESMLDTTMHAFVKEVLINANIDKDSIFLNN